jgi:hypothetical protein
VGALAPHLAQLLIPDYAFSKARQYVEVTQQWSEATEERYQAPVDAGLAEREVADRRLRLTYGFKPRCPKLPFVWAKPPWRVV